MSRQRNRPTRGRHRRNSPAAEPPQRDAPPGRRAVAIALILFATVFAASEIYTLRNLSATFDEPGHLAAGYAALADSDYRLDIEHPPLVRLWAALPLLSRRVNLAALDAMNRERPDVVAFQGPFDLAHQFLYRDNDADALLYRARLMIVLLGMLLGGLVFFWTLEWLGWRAALVALALYLTEPNIAAHAELVTNDLGVACFLFGSLYFLWRASRRWTRFDGLATAVFAACAILTKFSGVAVLPLIAALLAAAAVRGRIRPVNAAAIIAMLLVVAFVGAWAVYGFRYAPSRTPGWTFALHANPAAVSAVPATAAIAGTIDAHHLLPNALTEGFVHSQGLGTGRPAYLLGNYSTFGWWYYFPVAIALKTPVTLLVLVAAALVVAIRRRRVLSLDGEAFVVLPIALFLAAAMSVSLNIGVRHVLPVYPFLIVLGAAGARAFFASRPKRFAAVLAIVAVCAGLEFTWAYPDPLAFFNVFAGGPHNGYRDLADSNVDWGQALKPLSVWMKDRGVKRINLAYFGTADPTYYGMDVRYLWGTIMPGVTTAQLGPPELPGYVAVSATLLDGVPFESGMHDFYKPLRDRQPTADIGGSIKVYWVERRWW